MFSKEFTEGVDARIDGLPSDACPYPHGTEQRMDWMDGYHVADDCGDYDDPS